MNVKLCKAFFFIGEGGGWPRISKGIVENNLQDTIVYKKKTGSIK